MRKTSRRSFAATLTVAGATLPFVTADLVAQTTPPPAPDAKASALTLARTEVVRAEYGQFLSRDEVERIGKDFQDSAAGLKRLRDVKLVNADEPDVTFAALAKRW